MSTASLWRRRPTVITLWAASVAVALGLGWWAATQATQPPTVHPPAETSTTVEVVDGSVSVEQAYAIDVSWPATPIGVNGMSGTLTKLAVSPSGTLVRSGQIVYTVDLEPAVAISGSVPAFRDLERGVSGDDVRQLQEFLISSGYLHTRADGRFGEQTAQAVDRWSGHLGVAKTGTVPLGRVVFIPSLPATLAPSPEIRVGARVGPGESLLVGADAQPKFALSVLPEQIGEITSGMTVLIDSGTSTWEAQVSGLAPATDDTGTTIAVLAPKVGAKTICSDDCSRVINLGGKAILPGQVVLVPTTNGSQIPTAAISTDASGTTTVTLADGTRTPISVLASADGKSIVDGVRPGDRVVVPASNAG